MGETTPGASPHAVAAARAGWANYELLRLPHELKRLFIEWLEAHYPSKAARVLALIREARGGRLYDPRFGIRIRGRGSYAQILLRRFDVASSRVGLDGEPAKLDVSRFRVPPGSGVQGGLFA